MICYEKIKYNSLFQMAISGLFLNYNITSDLPNYDQASVLNFSNDLNIYEELLFEIRIIFNYIFFIFLETNSNL